MGVAHRDLTAANPCPNAAPSLPAPTVVGEFPIAANGHLNLVSIPRTEVWRISTSLLFHPQPIPVTNPPLPLDFIVTAEEYRQQIITWQNT